MIRIEITGDTVTPALDRLSAAMSDLTPVMQDIGELLIRSTRERFVEGKSPEGAAWAPKSPTTLAAYARRGVNAPRPLIGETGRLGREISYQAGPQSVEVGSNLIYAAVQQFGAAQGAFGRTARGGPIPWGNIPARPYLGLSPEDEIAIIATVDDWLNGVATAG